MYYIIAFYTGLWTFNSSPKTLSYGHWSSIRHKLLSAVIRKQTTIEHRPVPR